jgi:hypothetical protein
MIGLETHDHTKQHSLGCVRQVIELRVEKQCRFKFSINQNFMDEVVADVVPMDVCGVILRRPYLYVRDAIIGGVKTIIGLLKMGRNETYI